MSRKLSLSKTTKSVSKAVTGYNRKGERLIMKKRYETALPVSIRFSLT